MWSPGLPVKLPWDGGRKTAIPHGAIDNMIQLSYGYDLPDNRGKPRSAARDGETFYSCSEYCRDKFLA